MPRIRWYAWLWQACIPSTPFRIQAVAHSQNESKPHFEPDLITSPKNKTWIPCTKWTCLSRRTRSRKSNNGKRKKSDFVIYSAWCVTSAVCVCCLCVIQRHFHHQEETETKHHKKKYLSFLSKMSQEVTYPNAGRTTWQNQWDPCQNIQVLLTF